MAGEKIFPCGCYTRVIRVTLETICTLRSGVDLKGKISKRFENEGRNID